MSTAIPYVVGQWVRGDRFYGRRAEIREIVEGPRDGLWIVGTRRIGKTSLLKQVEHLTQGGEGGFFPVFWDLQGTATPEELGESFADALFDVEDRLGALGVDVETLEGDLFTSLGRLRRRLRAQGLTLLLLCDEVEELLRLRRLDPSLLGKLRRALHAREGVRTVLASSIRLGELAQSDGDTSPFLHGFNPPVFLRGLGDGEARDLLRQAHLPAGERPALGTAAAEEIGRLTANHPYLLQLLAKRVLELGDLDAATEQVAADPMVGAFFATDLDLLSDDERRVLRLVAAGDGAREEVPGTLHRLVSMGILGQDDGGRMGVRSVLFRRWLARTAPAPETSAPPPERGAFRLEGFRVEPGLNLLRSDRGDVRLEPKVMDLLVFLARRAGEVVSKEEILDAVWESRFVTDSALTRAVADLRKALGDDVRQPRFIATVSKRGYRLVAAVVRSGDGGG